MYHLVSADPGAGAGAALHLPVHPSLQCRREGNGPGQSLVLFRTVEL